MTGSAWRSSDSKSTPSTTQNNLSAIISALIIEDAICESYSASNIKTMGAEINILETDFKITLEGFATEQEANNIGNFTLEAIRALTKNLNLDISKLKCVIVSYNFSEALQKVTSSYQHKSPSSFTNKTGRSRWAVSNKNWQ
ncbi:hypothetical protein ACLB1R_33635 [Escherichia coli]